MGRLCNTGAVGDTEAITVTGLTKSYGEVHALRGVDLTVQHGECFALLGPNGAGKTTCTEILEGYRRRTSGDVRVLGLDPQSAPRQWRARLGIVLQNSRDLTDLTVGEVVTHFAGYYGDPRDPLEVIDAVGLCRPPSISSGRSRSRRMERRCERTNALIHPVAGQGAVLCRPSESER